ncbi:MAG: DNA repair ATPase [Phycisphaerae bacterium]|nr:DNA repair ATPase [Phycisphaerae bacterium]
MVDKESSKAQEQDQKPDQLTGGTYEILRNRLGTHGKTLQDRLSQLNAARKSVFGSIETKLLNSQRITTENNCEPRDMVPIGNKFIFGYNVFVGLRSEMQLSDVFAIYSWQDNNLTTETLDLLENKEFEADFFNLYKYYRNARFAKFAVIGPYLYMVFRVGKSVNDVKTFKWIIKGQQLQYCDNRSDHEYLFPPQHGFQWIRTTQDMHRNGLNPHISIEDIVFVETVGGDLTVKIEDNTESGQGIYSEPVENPDQTLIDAEIYYAIIDHMVIMKIKPYQEKDFRYLIYNSKLQNITRADSIKDSCVLLPENHGLIFSNGYYLATGEHKVFSTNTDNMVFEKRISSPNGEDHLYIFYNREAGVYVLLSYNTISQQIENPFICNGYSYFKDGTMLYFRAEQEPQKHHAVQVWQTPYYAFDYNIETKDDSELFKIGNKDIVRCMAECSALLNLINKKEGYVNLYLDINKEAQNIRDSFFWIDSAATFNLAAPLTEIAQTAAAAVDEYEKVVRTRENTRKEINTVHKLVTEHLKSIDYDAMDNVDIFVSHLSQLRGLRGQIISLRDLRYADLELIEKLETDVANETKTLSDLCVQFLLNPNSLTPYRTRIQNLGKTVPNLKKVTEVKEHNEKVSKIATELEMLTEIVSNLKITDATETTAIIDTISLVFAIVNQVKASLKNKLNELATIEGKTEFSAQVKLLDQSVINFLDLCGTPDKCDEYLTKASVQLETLESKFTDFEEFILELSEKREEIYNTFESRKVQLVAKRNQITSALMTSAQRILNGIRKRVDTLTDVNEINGFFAADMMVQKLEETVENLLKLNDSVKADDINSQLKSIQQGAIRQLKDRQALYEDGENIIRLGSHRFRVNNQNLEITMVNRDDQMYYHLTGTGFFEKVDDIQLQNTKEIWNLDSVSETPQTYRGEYLAYKMLEHLNANDLKTKDKLCRAELDEVAKFTREFMGPRFAEGYVKGVHDQDGCLILQTLLQLESEIGLLRFPTQARSLALLFWQLWDNAAQKQLLTTKIHSIGQLQQTFGIDDTKDKYVALLQNEIQNFIANTNLFDSEITNSAANYLFDELVKADNFCMSKLAADILANFEKQLSKAQRTKLDATIKDLHTDPIGAFTLLRDWLRSYIRQHNGKLEYAEEAAVLMTDPARKNRHIIAQDINRKIKGMVGAHSLINDGTYELNYCKYNDKLYHHENHIVPKFNMYRQRKKELTDKFSENLKLSEFEPHILTSFVRNQLIDQVYLPLLGDNLAKQIGSASDNKRTDLQGLLLLISPPGYGKTTLMEYIANRLGLIFVKINGPAIGNKVTSIDPNEAPNMAARQEIEKLNLAFEMGDNVMIYLDDIQHCNPEILQKFISLCDGQRRIEGVYKGKSRTYDLRGKRVCVVMAGNPYTESGEKFRIPDMLTNRADTYNIGDIVGDNFDAFTMSYIENSITSNPVLSKLANRSQKDIASVIKLAQTNQREGIDFEGNYTADELNEYVSIMKKLFRVRDVILNVNRQYIDSAAQADAYRTEPPFLLQGSYRNMNRIAQRVLPVMNDDELWTLIYSNYQQDAQTLTSGTEANLLKFAEITQTLTEEQNTRWSEIKRTFGRNQLLGDESQDKVAMVVRQLNAFGAGLDSIKDVLAQGVDSITKKPDQTNQNLQTETLTKVTDQFADKFDVIIDELSHQRKDIANQAAQQKAFDTEKDAHMLLSVLEEQYNTMETWLMRVTHNRDGQRKYVSELVSKFEKMSDGYANLMEFLRQRYLTEEQPKKSDESKPKQSENE